MDISEQKSLIREELLTQLRQLSAGERAGLSEQLRSHLTSSPLWNQARKILIFHPLRSEPDLAPLLDQPGRDLLLPRVTEHGLDAHRYLGTDSLRRSPFGMLEPDPERAPVTPIAEIDLAIVPALAFDVATRIRLGRGGGFYDRLLATTDFRATTIGIGFGFQMRSSLPAEPHDRPVDRLLNEDGWI